MTDAVGLHFSRPDHQGTNDVATQIVEFIRLPRSTEASLNLRLKIEKIYKLRYLMPKGL